MAEKILIVDDDPNVRFVLEQALAAEYGVLTAPDGSSAVEVVKKDSPALVLLDINMPGQDGITVLKAIRQSPCSPVVWMLTGVEDLDTVMKALKLGAAGYITKPFEVAKVREIVAGAVGCSSRKEGGQPADRPWRVKKKKQ